MARPIVLISHLFRLAGAIIFRKNNSPPSSLPSRPYNSSYTLALVDDPRCQPPTVSHLASLVPRSKPRHSSSTVPNIPAQTCLTFTFIVDHRLRAPHTYAPQDKRHVDPNSHLGWFNNSTQSATHVDNHSSQTEPHGCISTMCSEPHYKKYGDT